MRHLTLATNLKPELERLKRSSERGGLSLEVMGLGMEWTGFGLKVRLLLEFLKEQDGDDLIVFTDAYDVVNCDTAESIKEKFERFEAPVVFSSERGCFPDPSVAGEYPDAPTDCE
eukprot:TRINITY_DN11020_c0_g2_i3.p4 TRINITY_DN11020_c0_g2~~TRINITY_DN11020_c0_g2_i3.p4  ORF type:complete len:115 (+),score=24.61 TRINITY_DN11020_c0_g2_i3:736-1080(+)